MIDPTRGATRSRTAAPRPAHRPLAAYAVVAALGLATAFAVAARPDAAAAASSPKPGDPTTVAPTTGTPTTVAPTAPTTGAPTAPTTGDAPTTSPSATTAALAAARDPAVGRRPATTIGRSGVAAPPAPRPLGEQLSLEPDKEANGKRGISPALARAKKAADARKKDRDKKNGKPPRKNDDGGGEVAP